MADYTIVGFERVQAVLKLISPFVVLKRHQVELADQIIVAARAVQSRADLLAVAEMVDRFAVLNYSKRRTVNAERVSATYRDVRRPIPG